MISEPSFRFAPVDWNMFILQQPITSYFEHSGSGYEVELLKGTEINEGEELSSNEDGDTTEEQMDFTF